jgi:actin-like ATPase involved in cell morphogenesis
VISGARGSLSDKDGYDRRNSCGEVSVAYRLGVDLGTTFVAAAISYESQIEMVTLGDRSVVTPSVVYLRDDSALVTGEAAQRRAPNSPERVAREFKRRLGDPTPVILGGTPHAVTELLGAVLHDVLDKVSQTEGEQPERVVLTHPANWGPYRRGLFEEVPRNAGLPDIVSTTTEPEAAAAHYVASRKLNVDDTVAVYDLGGGTFDVTVLRKTAEGVDILGTPEGIERLGGIDFDEAILSHINFASDGALADLDTRDPKNAVALARLRQDCVLAKESLSVDTETLIPVFLPGRNFDVRISRDEFEKLVRAQVESTIGALSRTLRSARVEPAELSAVLLVGGSSRIPLVARMVSEELGRPIVVDTHPKYAVALGAATIASMAGPQLKQTVAASPARVAAASPAAPSPSPAPPSAPSPSAPTPSAPTPSAPMPSAPSSMPRPAAPAPPKAPSPPTPSPAVPRSAPAPPSAPRRPEPARFQPPEPPNFPQTGPQVAPAADASGPMPAMDWSQQTRPAPRGSGQRPGEQSGQQYPNQGQYPGQQFNPGTGQYPQQGQQPNQGQYPGQQYPGQQYPGQQFNPGSGQYPQQGQYPNQGQYPQQGGQYPQQQWQPQNGGPENSLGKTVVNWVALIALAAVVAFLAYTLVSKLRGVG